MQEPAEACMLFFFQILFCLSQCHGNKVLMPSASGQYIIGATTSSNWTKALWLVSSHTAEPVAWLYCFSLNMLTKQPRKPGASKKTQTCPASGSLCKLFRRTTSPLCAFPAGSFAATELMTWQPSHPKVLLRNPASFFAWMPLYQSRPQQKVAWLIQS